MFNDGQNLCIMYSDGLWSVKWKGGTWTARKHLYAKTLVGSTIMVGDINLVYNMIKLWYVWCIDDYGWVGKPW